MKDLQYIKKEVDHVTNEALFRLLIEQPEQGLPLLIQQYGGYVHTIIRSKLQDAASKEDIEETVSDVFVMFWQWAKEHPQTEVNIRAMLAVMTKRHAINRFRALTRHTDCDSLDDMIIQPEACSAADESVILMQTVKSLGEPDSEIILRRYYFGQSSREIGDALGLKSNTVDQRLSRGLKKLRMIFKED